MICSAKVNPIMSHTDPLYCCAFVILFLATFNEVVPVNYDIRLSDEERLMDHIFQDYNPSARPVIDSSKTVAVDLQFSLLQIQELNIRNQILTTTALLILEWYDERLAWTADISPLTEIVVDGHSIWKPEFAVINGANGIYEDFSDFQAVLESSGKIHWEPGGVFKTMCDVDIKYYPFDTQSCHFTFGAWSYDTTKMNLTTNVTTVGLHSYENNGEWEMLGSTVLRSEFFFECCVDRRFSNIKFTVNLRRRHTFYLLNVIVPGILTSAVLLSIFFCTPSQKVHIGVAALLSFRLFLLTVADTVPRTSDEVPLLGIYLTCTMAITTLAMVATVFVLNLHTIKDRPVPEWAARLFMVYASRLLCMSCTTPTQFVSRKDHGYSHAKLRSAPVPVTGYGYFGAKQSDADDINRKTRYNLLPSRDENQRSEYGGQENCGNSRNDYTEATHTRTNQNDATCIFLADNGPSTSAGLRTEIHQRRQAAQAVEDSSFTTKEKPNKADFSKDWVNVAAVCDRLFFWLCLIFIIATTLLLFHPLTTSNYFKLPMIEEK